MTYAVGSLILKYIVLMHSCPTAYVIRHFNRAINFSQNGLALPNFESSLLENYLSDSLENFSECSRYV